VVVVVKVVVVVVDLVAVERFSHLESNVNKRLSKSHRQTLFADGFFYALMNSVSGIGFQPVKQKMTG